MKRVSNEETSERELLVLGNSSPASVQEPLSVERAIRWIKEDPIEAMNDFDQLLGSPEKLSPADHFRALIGRTEVLSLQGKLSSARDDVLKALEILRKPDSQLLGGPWRMAEAHRYLARICIAENKAEEARSQFQTGHNLCKTHQELAKEYVSFERRQQNIPKALQICDEMIQIIPDAWDFFYQRAKIHFAACKWPQAHQDCTVFLQNKQSQIGYRKEVLDLGAKTCLKMENYSQASNFMEEACLLENTPLRAVARSRDVLDTRLLACMELIHWKMEEGWSVIEKAIEKSPEAALEVFDQLLKVDREPANLVCLLLGRAIACITLKQQENYSSARQNLERVQGYMDSLNPRTQERLFRWLAQLCAQESKTDGALSHFQAWYQLDRVGSVPVYLKSLQNMRQAPEKICELCNEILRSDPQNVAALHHRAHAHFSLGKWVEARRDCEALLKLDMKGFSRLWILDLCAEACLKLGDCLSAYKWLQEAYLLDVSSIVLERPKKLQEVYEMCKPNQTSQSTLKPPKEDLAHLVICGSKSKDPDDAIEIFDYVLKFRGNFSSTDLCNALLARAIHCINTKKEKYLASARQNLNEALKLLPAGFNSDIFPKIKGRILLCLALIDEREGNLGEASKRFKEAWKVAKTQEIFKAYLNFLVTYREDKAAINLCSIQESYEEISKLDLALWRISTYIDIEEWALALQNCKALLETSNLTNATQVKLFNHASLASRQMGDYQSSSLYATKACVGEFEGMPSFMERVRDLLKVKKAFVIDEHLRKLPAPREPAHATSLLNTYEKELRDFPTHHVRLLALRAELFLGQKKWDDAYEDDVEIRRIFKDHSDFLLKKELGQIEAASKDRAKQYFENFLVQAPNPEKVLQLFKVYPEIFSKKDRARADAFYMIDRI